MKFEQVSIDNFRQFYGEQQIKFGTDEEKNITIIQGSNGAGKTNLFYALQWCMYDISTDTGSDDQDMLPLLNERKLKEMDHGETAKVRVEIILEEGKPLYSIERVWTFEKQSDGPVVQHKRFDVMENTDSGWESKANPEEYLERILPADIRKFYFFDGERLDRYFRPGTEKDVKKTVEDVSQINLLDDAINHLSSTESDVSNEITGDIGEKMEDINDRIDDIDDDIKDTDRRLDKIQRRKESLISRKEEINQEFNSTSVQKAKTLQSERQDLESDLKNLQSDEEDVQEDIKDTLIRYGPIILAKEAISQTKKEIDELDEDVGLPPDIQRSFLQALLDRGECICGSDLENDREHKAAIKNLIDEKPPTKTATMALEGRYALEDALEDVDEFIDENTELSQDWNTIKADKDEIEDRLQEISDTMKKLGEEDRDWTNLEELEEERKDIEGEIEMLNKEYGRKEGKKNDLVEQKEELQQERSDLSEELDSQQGLKTKLDTLERGKKLLKNVKDDIMDEIRQDIEEKTEKQFFDLIWKDSFKEVNIDHDYRIEVINQHGRNALNNLSAGERQALALSFMAALKRVSGYSFPVVIDTPLGRISEEPRKNIADGLPSYLPETQITLLVTNTEYDKSFRDAISSSVGKEYHLDFDESTSSTRVTAER